MALPPAVHALHKSSPACHAPFRLLPHTPACTTPPRRIPLAAQSLWPTPRSRCGGGRWQPVGVLVTIVCVLCCMFRKACQFLASGTLCQALPLRQSHAPPCRAQVGGHVMAHASTIRLSARKGKGEQRLLKVVDAPNVSGSFTLREACMLACHACLLAMHAV